jgi:hypothetical protein
MAIGDRANIPPEPTGGLVSGARRGTTMRFASMATFHEELAKAGALLDASGLQPSSSGWRIRYSASKRTVTDGPLAEAKELIAGYTIIQTKSKEEAMEWTRRFPNPAIDAREGRD